MLRLPISGIEVRLREPDGADALLVREMPGTPVAVALTLLSRLAGAGSWDALSVTDFEILLLGLRTQLFGDALALGLTCSACGGRIEIGFRVTAYLQDIAPCRPNDVIPDSARAGWFQRGGTHFRLPSAGDQVAVAGRPDAARLLAERCIDPSNPDRKQRGSVERAMALMAPEVSRPVRGTCPECGGGVEAPLHVTRLVMSELGRDAIGIHDEIDLIALSYHWPEPAILALPSRRRRAYAERIRRRRQAA